MPIVVGFAYNVLGRLKPNILVAMFVDSPKEGARKDVPHEPRIVAPRSSDTSQLKPSFGLLVPPKSLYWSCRHDASKSSFAKPGIAFASPKIGTFNCAKPAQIPRLAVVFTSVAIRDGELVAS